MQVEMVESVARLFSRSRKQRGGGLRTCAILNTYIQK